MNVITSVNRLLEKGVMFCLVTVVTSRTKGVSPGKKIVIIDDGTIVGTFGSEQFDQNISSYAQMYMKQKKSGIINFEDKIDLFFNVMAADDKLLICGAGHIAIPLAQFSLQAGFQVTVLDDRSDFAKESRFPNCKVIAEDFTIALKEMELGSTTFVVVITRGHEHDSDCLYEILKNETAYVGLIGSRRRVKFVLGMLQRDGIPQKRLKELFTPIGLPIGAESPVEIALSIVSELVCVRKKGWKQARALRMGVGIDL